MILTGRSFPRIAKNTIIGNITCGMLFRENSYGTIEKNTFDLNYYNISIKKLEVLKNGALFSNNTIKGTQNDITLKGCVIF